MRQKGPSSAPLRRRPFRCRNQQSMQLGAFSISLAFRDIEASTSSRKSLLARSSPGQTLADLEERRSRDRALSSDVREEHSHLQRPAEGTRAAVATAGGREPDRPASSPWTRMETGTPRRSTNPHIRTALSCAAISDLLGLTTPLPAFRKLNWKGDEPLLSRPAMQCCLTGGYVWW
jgi:hypothetical protein